MILCLDCRKIWPAGSVYCGECGGALGKRICPEGHVNLLTARHCAACGSPKLSKGAPALNLRSASWVAVIAFAVIFWAAFGNQIAASSRGMLDSLLTGLLLLLLWSGIIVMFFGERGQKFVGGFWNLAGRLFELFVNILLTKRKQ